MFASSRLQPTDCLPHRKLRTWYASKTPIPSWHSLTLKKDIFIDNVHVELSLWDTAGQEEFDRLRSLSYDDTHAIMLCFSASFSLFHDRLAHTQHVPTDTFLPQVDSPDSLENVESKWVGEIAENCPGVRLVLVALKCDLREQQADDEENTNSNEPKRGMIDYKQGLAVAEKIKALRYLGMGSHTIMRLCGPSFNADIKTHRVLGHEEQGRQRSIYRSRPGRPPGQERQRRQGQQLLRHVASCYSLLHILSSFFSTLLPA